MKLTWYYYFSWWIFIWFILFKLNIIKYSPYLVYLLAVTYIIFKISTEALYFIFYDNRPLKNYDVIIGWLVIVFIIDILPFFYLKKQTDKNTIIFTLGVILVYLLYMRYLGINIFELYLIIIQRKLSDRYTLDTFIKEIFSLKNN